MLLVIYASAATLPGTVTAVTAFMNMKNERLISIWKTKNIPQNKQVKRIFMDCINVCVKMFHYSLNKWNYVKTECWNFKGSSY